MNDDLTLGFVSGQDQPLPFQVQMVHAVESQVDSIIMRCIALGSPDEAFEAGAQFITAGVVSGIGLAKLAVEIKKAWPHFEIGAEFEDVAYKQWGLSVTTLRRYMRIWEMRVSGDAPQELLDQIANRPLKDQQAIATLWESGELEDAGDWEKIAKTSTNAELLQTIREIRGTEQRSSSIVLRLERDGTIQAWTKDGTFYVGHLAVEEQDENELLRKAINRIINNSGIIPA